jgi:hypothetical protein
MADDTKPNAVGLALLNAQMDSLGREVGARDPNDPKRADLVKEIFRLTELAAELRRAFNETLQLTGESCARPRFSLGFASASNFCRKLSGFKSIISAIQRNEPTPLSVDANHSSASRRCLGLQSRPQASNAPNHNLYPQMLFSDRFV